MFNLNIMQEALDKSVRAKDLSWRTVNDYISCLTRLNEKLGNKTTPAEIEKAIYELSENTAQGHKHIAAVRRYEREILGAEGLLLFGEPLMRLYQQYGEQKLGKEISLSEDTYIRKINRLNNERLKLAFRLEYRSGLRISEIAALDDQDIEFGAIGDITVIVRDGKGRKGRTVKVVNDVYLYDRLKAHIESLLDGESLFYSESYLKKKAYEHGIKTHDLRRINSRERFRKELQVGNGRRAARRTVGKELGHVKPATTNIYLGHEWSDQNEPDGSEGS